MDKLWGEVALTKHEYPKKIVVAHYRQGGQEKTHKFSNFGFVRFDRNLFIGSFKTGKLGFVLANVHLYFGAFQNSTDSKDRDSSLAVNNSALPPEAVVSKRNGGIYESLTLWPKWSSG